MNIMYKKLSLIGLVAMLGMALLTVGSCKKEPRNNAVTGISLNKTSIELTVGFNASLTVTLTPANATNTAVSFESSDESVVVVDQDGFLTAISPGTAVITVTSANGGLTATCDVTVLKKVPKVTQIKLDQVNVSLFVGKTLTLTALASPETADGESIEWASDKPGVAKVDKDGVVTGIAPGTARISANFVDGNLSASCLVKVTEEVIKVSEIKLDMTQLFLYVGMTYQLKSTVLPENAHNKSLKWQSSNPAIASVDDNGLVTAKSDGKVKINASAMEGGVYATCDVEVGSIKATGVSLNVSTMELDEGDTGTLTATVVPSNATNKKVRWESTNPSAFTVNQDGVVTAISAGKGYVRVFTEDGGWVAQCLVTVRKKIIPLQNITLNYSDILLPLGEGGKYQLKAKLYPENTTDEIAWKIDDGGVARVNQSGLVSSRSAGEATITVYSKTRPSVKAVCKVKVDDVRLRFRRDEVTGQKGTTTSFNDLVIQSSLGEVKWYKFKFISADEGRAAIKPEAYSHYLIYFRTVGKCVIRVEYGYGQGYLARDLTVYVTE